VANSKYDESQQDLLALELFMATVSFVKNRPSFEVLDGSNLMRALLDHGLPVASSCQSDGVCAKCRIQVVKGKEHVSPEGDRETFLRERHNIPRGERVSCQVTIHGDVTVDTGYW
jgi:2Fe-2S ferredoxin